MEKEEKVPLQLLPEGEWRSYHKKHVAVRSFFDTKVIGAGDTPEEALTQAQKNGCFDPIIFYVFDEKLVFVGRVMNIGELINILTYN